MRSPCNIQVSHRRAIAGAAIVAFGVLAGLPGVAYAQPTGDQNFRLIFRADPSVAPGMVVAHGPITGVGEARVTSASGSTFTSTYEFDEGAVFVEVTPFDGSFEPNLKSCTARVTTASEVEITGGTGSFEGASGAGTASSRGLLIGQRGPQGECLLFQQPPARGIEIVTVSTSLDLPG
jgi:hypothetical protein